MKAKFLLILLMAAALAYTAYFYHGDSGAKVGAMAPDFTLPARSNSISLSQFRGQLVLLNFWATWCPPCAREMPSMEALRKRMEGKPFQILAVSVDEGGWTAIDAFLKKLPVLLNIVSDAKGDVAALYGTYMLPESYLIDKEGRIIKKYVGPEDWMEDSIVGDIEKNL